MVLHKLNGVRVTIFRNVSSRICGTLCGPLEIPDHVENHWFRCLIISGETWRNICYTGSNLLQQSFFGDIQYLLQYTSMHTQKFLSWAVHCAAILNNSPFSSNFCFLLSSKHISPPFRDISSLWCHHCFATKRMLSFFAFYASLTCNSGCNLNDAKSKKLFLKW